MVNACHHEITNVVITTKVDEVVVDEMDQVKVVVVMYATATATATTILEVVEAETLKKNLLRNLILTQPVLAMPQSGGQHNNQHKLL